jgi:hypothetical protein
MPVITGHTNVTKLPAARGDELFKWLVAEREGKMLPGGPVIFEIPLEQSDKLDIVVVWDEWEGVRSEDRTQLITKAYQDKSDALALALGVTYAEANDQGILPVRVRLRFAPQPVFPEDQVRSAKLAVGGFERPEGNIELRFPTRTMAEEAVRQLEARLPGSTWMTNYAVD